MPPLTRTIIHANHPSTAAHSAFTRDYLVGEVAENRMSGPLSHTEMEAACGGPFQCSPYLIVVRPGAVGQPDKLRLCINLSKSGGGDAGAHPSVNDLINPDDFITRFDSAAIMAEKVRQVPRRRRSFL
jgi:hypothetical protein